MGEDWLGVPPGLVARMTGRPAEGDGGLPGDDWLAELPARAAEALDRWELTPDGIPMHGYCALVLPVRRRGDRLVLKLGWPHPEARHEHLALRAWAGRGAVHLVAAHPARDALLLERLDAARDLGTEDVETSCAVIGRLLARLDVPAFPQLDRLSDWTRGFLAATADVRAVAAAGLPRRFVEQARSSARDLAGEPGIDGRLVHTDLHDANVLAAELSPWLAIDPKPLAAESAFALAPALWNRWHDAVASGDPNWHLKCRLGWLAEAAGVDEARARAWSLIRLVAVAHWYAAAGDPNGGPAPMTAFVAAMKAMASDR
jgi:streptomycin 6-kinase